MDYCTFRGALAEQNVSCLSDVGDHEVNDIRVLYRFDHAGASPASHRGKLGNGRRVYVKAVDAEASLEEHWGLALADRVTDRWPLQGPLPRDR